MAGDAHPDLDLFSRVFPLPYRIASLLVLGEPFKAVPETELLTLAKEYGPGVLIFIAFHFSKLCVF